MCELYSRGRHWYEWENVAYVCSSPQLFNIVFIWGGQALTRHTNTHPPLSGLCHGLLRPGPVILISPHIWILLLPFSAPAFHPAQHQKYTQPHTVITQEMMKTIQLPKWDSSEVHEEALSRLQPPLREFKWNIKIYVLSHLNKDAGYWFHVFLTGMDAGLTPPQMEESK